MTIGRNGTHRERLLYVFVSFCFVMYVYGRYVKIMLPLLECDGNGALGNKFPPHTSQHPKKWWYFIVVYGVPALSARFWRIFRNFLRENLSECQVAKSQFGPRDPERLPKAPQFDRIKHTFRIDERPSSTERSRVFWDCEGFLRLPATIITPGVVAVLIAVSLKHMQARLGRSHTQTRLKSHDTIYDVKSVILIFYYTSATCFYSKERKSYFMVSLIEVVTI